MDLLQIIELFKNFHGFTAMGAMVSVFIIGLFRGSSAYKGIRNTLGKFSENLGLTVSRLGNSKLKGVYEPIEAVLIDFVLFMAEQFAVGLRADNLDKMAIQADRLEGVGSETRLQAIKSKMEDAVKTQQIATQEVKDVVAEGDALQKDRLDN